MNVSPFRIADTRFARFVLGAWLACTAACRDAARSTDGKTRAPVVTPNTRARPLAQARLARPPGCVVFVGDVALGRELGEALARAGHRAWASFARLGEAAWIGNLEGAVRPSPTTTPPSSVPCTKPKALCLGFEEAALGAFARSPFVALSLANNHAMDHGRAGFDAMHRALQARGLAPLHAESSTEVRALGQDWAFVAVSFVDLTAAQRQRILEATRLRVGLAAGMRRTLLLRGSTWPHT